MNAPVQESASTIVLVTVLFNCESYLPLFFQCLGRQDDRGFVVVVIDNASKDNSLQVAHELAAAHGVTCEFIANGENLGIAVGNNQGIEWAMARDLEHIVLINNDIGCGENLIGQIRALAIAPGELSWTCRSYNGDSNRLWFGGGELSFWRARGMHFGEARSSLITEPTEITYAPTCLMYVHASVFRKIGLMDPLYFVYYDDTDFCRRMNDAGIRLIYDPDVTFRHYVGGSSGGALSSFFIRISTRNKFIYIRKHYFGISFFVVLSIAIASKMAQLASSRRKATLSGLMDAWRMLIKEGAWSRLSSR